MPLLSRFPEATTHAAIIRDAEHAEFALRLASALKVLLFLWLGGILFDWLRAEDAAFGSLLSAAILRLSIVFPWATALWRLRRSPRPGMLQLRAIEVSSFVGASALVGLLALTDQQGGTSYAHEVILFLALRALYFPQLWRSAFGGSLFIAIGYGAVMFLGGLLSSRTVPGLAEGRFFIEQFMILVVMIGCLAAGDFVAGLRRRPFRARVIARYRLLREIGRGGMASVWEAFDSGRRRKVALKILADDNPTLVKRFEREIAAIRETRHANIIRLYDYGVTGEGLWYYAMELLDGETLEATIDREGTLPWKRVVHIGRQLASAVAEAHRSGILHRDIKPKNVVRIERGGDTDFIKLIDFGIVRLDNPRTELTQLTGRGFVPGTPEFLAPEAYQEGDIDARADVYGVGLVLYYLLSGKLPFSEVDTEVARMSRIAVDPIPLSERVKDPVPPWLEEIIHKCIAREPSERFLSGVHLFQRFEEISTAHLVAP